MRIGYDAKRFFNNNTGLGNYARTLIASLSNAQNDVDYVLFTPKISQNPRTKFIDNCKKITLFVPKSSILKSYWRSFGILKDIIKSEIDIFHGLSNELPLNIKKAKCKSVVTIHDLIYERNPEFYPWLDRYIYAYKYRKSCENADTIIAISEQTKRDIIEFYKINPDKIKVIYQSCHEQFLIKKEKSAIELIKQELNLPASYLLYVGTINERKNLMSIIEAMHCMGENALPLVVIGDGKGYLDKIKIQIKVYNLQHKVMIFNKIDFTIMPQIYQGASMFIYPSFFEGFGIPIIEALYSEVPVITSTGSCFGEAGGPHTKYIDPNNPEMISEAILDILSDENLRKMMIVNGRKYVAKFDHDVIAEEWNNFYRQLV
jgi:glycosyltransferase involved in cell wall biosynthesis